MPDFASNDTFVGLPASSAAFEGKATKVAMTEAQRANGFVPRQPVAVEHLNAELNQITADIAELQGELAELDASEVPYEPGEAGDWPDPPETVGEALDALAAHPATHVPYEPAEESSWAEPVPANVANALDAIAERSDRSRCTVSEIVDDFAYVAVSESVPILWGDSGPWETTAEDSAAAYTNLNNAGSGNFLDEQHPGGVHTFGGAGAQALYKLPGSRSIQTLERMMCIVRFHGAGGVLGFEFGLSGGAAAAINTTGVDAFTIQHDNTGNWKFRTGNSGGNTTLDSGIAVVNGSWIRLEMFRASGGGLFFSVNGSEPVQAASTLPNQANLVTPVVRTNPGLSEIGLDYVFWRFRTPSRA